MHLLRATLFNGELLLYCSCGNYIRIVALEASAKEAEWSWKIHKDAWEEEITERRQEK
jgi:hypothetical protein